MQLSRIPLVTSWCAVVILAPLVMVMVLRPSASAADFHGIFTLVVDQVQKGQVIAVIRANDVLVPAKDLADSGLIGLVGKRETISGEIYVSLASLAPGIEYQVDPKTDELRLTARASFLGESEFDLRTRRAPEKLIYAHNPSLFFNYSVQLSNLNTVSTFGEVGLSLFGNSLLDTTLGIGSTGQITRGISSLMIDDAADLRRISLGEVSSDGFSLLGGSALVGGINISRALGIDPYAVIGPQGTFTGTTTTPSTVEIFNNGALVRKIAIPPGPFVLNNIPYFQGSGITQVVVTDAFGRKQEYSQPYNVASSLLARGVADYSFTFGPVKEGGAGGYRYGKLIFNASGRYGLSNYFTPGFRIEGSKDVLSAGPDVVFSTPFGGLALSAGVSRGTSVGSSAPGSTARPGATPGAAGPGTPGARRSLLGYAGALTAQYTGRPIGIGGEVVFESAHYANLSLTPDNNRNTITALIGTSFPVSENVSISPQVSYSKTRDDGSQSSISVTSNFRLAKNLVFFLSGSLFKASKTPVASNVFAGLSLLLGPSTVFTGTFQRADGGSASGRGNTYGAQLTQSPPLGPGFGYLLQEQLGPGFEQQRAQLTDHGQRATYEFDFDRQGKNTNYMFHFAGSLVVIAGRLFAAPAVQGSYALIRTGVPDVEGYLFHQPVGRTDARGDLLVPKLVQPYYANNFGIEPRDIPVSYRIDATEELVAPPNRGGAVVVFPIRLLRSFIGKLIVAVAGKRVTPSFGTVTVTADGKSYASPIGRDGAFFLDSPPLGRYPARIDFEQGTCSFTLDIQGGNETLVKLGTLTCTM